MQPLAELLLNFFEKLVHARAGLGRDADASRLARQIVVRKQIALVVATDDRYAGLCQLLN